MDESDDEFKSYLAARMHLVQAACQGSALALAVTGVDILSVRYT